MEEYQLPSAKTHVMLRPADGGHTKRGRKDEALDKSAIFGAKNLHHSALLR
jgi:hypothetical protein